MLIKANKILLTGATGSFGKAFISSIIRNNDNLDRLVIYSRDELKQWEMQQVFSPQKYNFLRYFIGDIRDKERLNRAMKNINCVVHAAALKQVPAAEYNPMEFIKTNILGTENIVNCALDNQVNKVISLSTDKAAAPINLYGATKLCADKLVIAANNIKGDRDIRFSVVRYGNVMGSRGSVIPLFLKQAKEGRLSITDNRMTRFNITLNQGVDLVRKAINNSLGGEIFVPKIPSYRISDLVNAIAPNAIKTIIGTRPGEKLHEQMITSADSFNTYENDEGYVILNTSNEKNLQKIKKDYKKVKEGFSYSSDANTKFLDIEEIQGLIRKNLDSEFKPI